MSEQAVTFKLEYSSGGESPAWTEITNIETLEPGESKASTIEIMHNGLTDRVKRYKPGWGERGEWSATQVSDDGGAAVAALYKSTKNWKATIKDAETAATIKTVLFSGYVSSLKDQTDQADVYKLEFKIQECGPVSS